MGGGGGGGGMVERGRQGEVGEGKMEGMEERRERWGGGKVVEVRRGRSSNSVKCDRSHTCIYILTFGVGFHSERFIIDSWERKEVMSSSHHHKQETKCTYVYHGLLFKGTRHPHLNEL